jgi:hypothetical protein
MAPNETAVLVAGLERLQRVANLHLIYSRRSDRRPAFPLAMVGPWNSPRSPTKPGHCEQNCTYPEIVQVRQFGIGESWCCPRLYLASSPTKNTPAPASRACCGGYGTIGKGGQGVRRRAVALPPSDPEDRSHPAARPLRRPWAPDTPRVARTLPETRINRLRAGVIPVSRRRATLISPTSPLAKPSIRSGFSDPLLPPASHPRDLWNRTDRSQAAPVFPAGRIASGAARPIQWPRMVRAMPSHSRACQSGIMRRTGKKGSHAQR